MRNFIAAVIITVPTMCLAQGAPQNANLFWATPTTGTGYLSLRAIVASDLPAIPTTSLTGVLQAAQEPAHTGDITNTAGSLTTTLATVNSNTGSFGGASSVPNFTVNGKGLITAAGSTAVVAPAGTLSGTTLNATVVTSSLTTVGTITTGSFPAANLTGTTLASNVVTSSLTSYSGGTFGTAAHVATGTSGATIPLLNGVNTWSGSQTFSAATNTFGIANSGGSNVIYVNNPTVNAATNSYLWLETGTTNSYMYFDLIDNNEGIIQTGAGAPNGLILNTATTSPIVFETNSTVAMTVLSSQVLKMGAASFTANGSVATAMSSLGPTGSHATIQEWFTVQDSAGTVRYIPAF